MKFLNPNTNKNVKLLLLSFSLLLLVCLNFYMLNEVISERPSPNQIENIVSQKH